MLYSYNYPQGHKLEQLNAHLLNFFTNIRNVPANATYIIENYFSADFVIVLNRSEELNNKFKAFFDSYKKLQNPQKEAFFQLVLKSQNIRAFFLDTSLDCSDIKREPLELILGDQTLRNLMAHLFKTTLKAFDIDGHYKVIYTAMSHKICPFCGLETMHQSYREDYDHLAAKRHFPLAAVHPANLAPMCHTCNSKNKGEQDVLNNANGTRKRMIYPYSEQVNITFDYTGTIIPQTDINNQLGNWVVNILPDDETTRNWNEIFGIKTRYKDDYLKPSFEEWIDDFIKDCIEQGKDLTIADTISTELKSMSDNFKRKWYLHSNIIKGPLFDYLSTCNNEIFYNSIKDKFNKISIQVA
ncbi:hypothetical protein [Mucilaginibacter sp.]|uniref:hypothetical protein n=1 Tax=Mucilaginibacter sp. TaxID=1882438 RepID=UPI003D1484C9